VHTIVYHQPAATLRHMLDDVGLRASRRPLCPMPAIEPQLDYARELGLQYMVAMLRPNPQTLDEYRTNRRSAESQTGSLVHDHGMKFALLFHNHELKPQDGTSGFRRTHEAHRSSSRLSLRSICIGSCRQVWRR
jgi:hypothetical protein